MVDHRDRRSWPRKWVQVSFDGVWKDQIAAPEVDADEHMKRLKELLGEDRVRFKPDVDTDRPIERQLGHEAERAAIVAWLRKVRYVSPGEGFELLADAIERGEHLPGGRG
jgi:hypothetical protein